MEVNVERCHLVLTVTDLAHVDAARRSIIRHASQRSADENLLGRLTVVVQEMGRNLVIHAGGGELLLVAATSAWTSSRWTVGRAWATSPSA